MTDLEKYVWKNQNRQTRELMDETGLTAQEIWAAYDRAFAQKRKNGQTKLAIPKRSWTAEEVARLRQMRENGITISDMAIELNRSNDSVYQKLRELGYTETVRNWTEEELARLEELRGQGATYEQIGRELNRSPSAVRGMVSRQLAARREKGQGQAEADFSSDRDNSGNSEDP